MPLFKECADPIEGFRPSCISVQWAQQTQTATRAGVSLTGPSHSQCFMLLLFCVCCLCYFGNTGAETLEEDIPSKDRTSDEPTEQSERHKSVSVWWGKRSTVWQAVKQAEVSKSVGFEKWLKWKMVMRTRHAHKGNARLPHSVKRWPCDRGRDNRCLCTNRERRQR